MGGLFDGLRGNDCHGGQDGGVEEGDGTGCMVGELDECNLYDYLSQCGRGE